MRTAKQRMREHKYHTRSGHLDMSAIAKHTHEESHTMNWSARILAHESDKTKQKVKEALAIRTTEKKRGADKLMNQDKGLDVSKIWLDFFSVLSRTSLVTPLPPFGALTPSTYVHGRFSCCSYYCYSFLVLSHLADNLHTKTLTLTFI